MTTTQLNPAESKLNHPQERRSASLRQRLLIGGSLLVFSLASTNIWRYVQQYRPLSERVEDLLLIASLLVIPPSAAAWLHVYVYRKRRALVESFPFFKSSEVITWLCGAIVGALIAGSVWAGRDLTSSKHADALPAVTHSVGADLSFKQGIRTFIEGRAFPAHSDLEGLLQAVYQREANENVQIMLNNYVLAGGQRIRQHMLALLAPTSSESEAEINSSVCAFFDSYQEGARWVRRVGGQTSYDFSSSEYRNWLRKDETFESEFQAFVTDPRYKTFADCNRFDPSARIR
jgi:hypothetical protein